MCCPPSARPSAACSPHRAWRARWYRSPAGVARDPGSGGAQRRLYSHEWIRDFPQEAWKARYTYTLWGFPQAAFPKLLGEYFAFCKSHYKQHGYRCNVVNGASRLHQDRNSLFSVSFAGPMFTLEPSSTGDRGWDEFLIDFNDFAAALGGIPTFNQSRSLKPEHVAKAFGERAKLFRALRQRTDPLDRALQQLLRAISSSRAGRQSGLVLQVRLEEPQVLVDLAGNAGEQVGGIRIAEIAGLVDRRPHRPCRTPTAASTGRTGGPCPR